VELRRRRVQQQASSEEKQRSSSSSRRRKGSYLGEDAAVNYKLKIGSCNIPQAPVRGGESRSVAQASIKGQNFKKKKSFTLRRFETGCGYCFCSSKLRNMAYCRAAAQPECDRR
jgi:hypothetical protein